MNSLRCLITLFAVATLQPTLSHADDAATLLAEGRYRDAAAAARLNLAAADGSVVVVNVEGVAPTEENVRDGSYPISRYLYLYTAEPPRCAIQDFLAWVVGEAGQAVVRRNGYVALRPASVPERP